MSTKRLYEIIYEVSRTVNSSLDPSEVLSRIAEQVTRAMNVKGCFIRLLDRSGKVLKPAAYFGLSERYAKKGVVEVAKSGLDREAFTGKVVQIGDAGSDPRFQYGGEATKEGLVSVLVAPLSWKAAAPSGCSGSTPESAASLTTKRSASCRQSPIFRPSPSKTRACTRP